MNGILRKFEDSFFILPKQGKGTHILGPLKNSSWKKSNLLGNRKKRAIKK